VAIHSPVDPLGLGLRFIYQELSLVPQLDIARNMFLGMEPRRLGFVRRRELYERAARYLEKFNMDLDPRAVVGRLSVTQQKLVEIARALVKEAQVLVLDEATSSVDTGTEILIQSAIKNLLAGRTSIIVAHRLSTIQNADRIIVMHKGEIREMGTHQELLSRDGIYRKLYRLQYKDQEIKA
jgi:ABC-type multidrug transport system fused ATPase/permease subunit